MLSDKAMGYLGPFSLGLFVFCAAAWQIVKFDDVQTFDALPLPANDVINDKQHGISWQRVTSPDGVDYWLVRRSAHGVALVPCVD